MTVQPPWAWCGAPHPGELLSSFLIRVAWRHGSSPTRFCALHFPGIPIWNRDIDRSASPHLIHAVAVKSGRTIEQVRQMTLQETRRNVSGCSAGGVVPWILPIGVYHRTRRNHGLQYCPACLSDGRGFNVVWRFAFVTLCPIHLIALRDGCPHCDAPVVPHQQLAHTHRCHVCHLRLVEQSCGHDAARVPDGRFQEKCLSALSRGSVSVGERQVEAATFFLGLRGLASVYAQVRRQESGIASGLIERMRVAQRNEVMPKLLGLLEGWPDAFLAFAGEHRLTQLAFRCVHLPVWLKSVTQGLPYGIPRSSDGRRSLQRNMRALSKTKQQGWRSERAAMLCAAARAPRR